MIPDTVPAETVGWFAPSHQAAKTEFARLMSFQPRCSAGEPVFIVVSRRWKVARQNAS
jgi:hypothetical protein